MGIRRWLSGKQSGTRLPTPSRRFPTVPKPPRQPRTPTAPNPSQATAPRSPQPTAPGPGQIHVSLTVSAPRARPQAQQLRQGGAGRGAKPAPPAPDDAVWVVDRPVLVAGAAISGGRFYFGHQLGSTDRLFGGEASLVNPQLPVNFRQPDWAGSGLDYWPTYGRLSPEGRGAYLSWLSSSRDSTHVPIGYIFIYYYGLERRAIVEVLPTAGLHGELEQLAAEVERLLNIYGSDASFHRYASDFLAMILLKLASQSSAHIDPPPEAAGYNWEVPPLVKLGLGRFVANGQPIPVEWALTWAKAHPNIYFRTPANRCTDEFTQLFALRYHERFGYGMVLKADDTPLTVSYQPASPSLNDDVVVRVDVPDVTALVAPAKKLQELVNLCTDQLDAYSRWLGRHPDEKGSLAAVALLPPELMANTPSTALDKLMEWVESSLAGRQEAVVDAPGLLSRWPSQTQGKLKKAEASALADLLESQGFGVEPDVRFGGPVLGSGKVALFRLEGPPASAGLGWGSAAAVLQLAAAVVAAPGVRNQAVFDATADEIQAVLNLPASEHRRIRAHLRWAASSPPNLSVRKRSLAKFDLESRQSIGRFLVDVAATGGDVGPEQVSALTSAYKVLGLEPASMYSLLNERAAGAPASEPVEVIPARPGPAGEAIPPSPRSPSAVVLDQEAIKIKLAESAKAAALLGQIFTESEPDVPTPVDPPLGTRPLSEAQAILLRELAARPVWSHSDFADLAASVGLLPAGALEALNDAALEVCGDPVLIGGDILEVDPAVLKELLRERV